MPPAAHTVWASPCRRLPRTNTSTPARPSSMAARSPAAPAPTINTSVSTSSAGSPKLSCPSSVMPSAFRRGCPYAPEPRGVRL